MCYVLPVLAEYLIAVLRMVDLAGNSQRSIIILQYQWILSPPRARGGAPYAPLHYPLFSPLP